MPGIFAASLALAGCGGGSGGGSAATGSDSTVGAASVNWVAPAQRQDGDNLPMTELSGYRIYYGTRSGQYQYSVEVRDAYASSYVIRDLPPATYYFAVTAIDMSGRESGYSNETVRVVES